MKIVNSIIVAAIILVGVFFTTSSCAKKTNPAPAPGPTNTVTTYTFNALGVTAAGVQYSISNQTQMLQITGTTATSNVNSTDQTVKITINSAVNSVGSYTLSASVNNTGVYSSGSNSFIYSTGNSPYVGTLNISKMDMTNRLMSASFNFNAQETFPNNNNSGTIYGSFTNVGF